MDSLASVRCQHTPADRMLIAQVSGAYRHRDSDHRDRWPQLIARMREITTNPHLMAHAATHYDPAYGDELLELAGADMAEVARYRAGQQEVSDLAGMADRINAQHAADRARAFGAALGQATEEG